MTLPPPFKSLLPLALAGVLAGCEGDAVHEITRTRTTGSPANPARQLTSAQRFRYAGAAPAPHDSGQGEIEQSAAAPRLVWDTPAGWKEIPPTSMRVVNLQIQGGDGASAECYVTVLRGSGGGVTANVNRWRSQMALPPLSEDEIASLPQRGLLGQPAVYLELDGEFTGMGGSGQPGYTMAGLILHLPVGTIFVKLVGPAGLVDAELARFHSFCASLRLDTSQTEAGDGHDHSDPNHVHQDEPPAQGPQVGPVPDGPTVAWDAPKTWLSLPSQGGMRQVTFKLGASGQTECYVTALTGPAGGLAANLNRWRREVGQPPLSPEHVQALPTIDVLGRPAPLLEAEGTYSGMSGAPQPDAMLLGVVCQLDTHTLFVKMVGPKADVQSERERFLAFCRSLRPS